MLGRESLFCPTCPSIRIFRQVQDHFWVVSYFLNRQKQPPVGTPSDLFVSLSKSEMWRRKKKKEDPNRGTATWQQYDAPSTLAVQKSSSTYFLHSSSHCRLQNTFFSRVMTPHYCSWKNQLGSIWVLNDTLTCGNTATLQPTKTWRPRHQCWPDGRTTRPWDSKNYLK